MPAYISGESSVILGPKGGPWSIPVTWSQPLLAVVQSQGAAHWTVSTFLGAQREPQLSAHLVIGLLSANTEEIPCRSASLTLQGPGGIPIHLETR